jgi:RND family efflux transporter MFP subunit
MRAPFNRIMAGLAAATLLSVTIGGCQRGGGGAKAEFGGETPTVVVQTLAPKRIQDVIELDGSVSPLQQVNLVARVSGTLEQAKFKDGERVRAGQVMFIIEQPPYVEQLRLNQAKLDQCQADYKRQVELLKENASSQANVETSLSNLRQAQANVKLAQINLDYTIVTAPFDGVVGRRQVDPGNYVGATQGGTVLATLMQVSPAYVYASIGEREALRVRARMPSGDSATDSVGRAVVFARLQGDSGKGEQGVLDFIDHQVNPTTGTVQLRGRFANKDYHLLPGFYAKLTIEVGPDREALVLARSVIENDQQGDYVFVVGDDNHAHRRNVSSALLPGEDKEVLSGIKAGDRVVVEGANKLSDGEPVQIVSANQAA